MATLPPPPVGSPANSFVWIEWYRQLRNFLVSEGGTIPWNSVDKTGSNLTDLAIRQHNDLQSIQGGTAGERQHLTTAQHTALTGATWTDLTDGGTTTLHTHDLPHGEMYCDNINSTITITTANTWTEITDTTSSVDPCFTAGNNSGVTFQNNTELKVLTAGKWFCSYMISSDASGANQEIEGGITVNGTISLKTTSHETFTAAGATFILTGNSVLTLAANDVLRLALNNNTNTDDIVLQHANLTIVKIAS